MVWHQTGDKPLSEPMMVSCADVYIMHHSASMSEDLQMKLNVITGFYTKGRPLVKSNLICPLDKLSWPPGCPVLNITI